MIQQYFQILDKGVQEAYDLANKARSKGHDPVSEVEIPLAQNMVERVVGLVSVVSPQVNNPELIKRLHELEKKFGAQDWRVALTIALEVAQQTFCTFEDKKEAIEVALRIGLGYITNGVVSSPLEGFTRLEVKQRKDGGEYLALCFSGPIRSAGTTAVCIFVALADYVRKNMGYQPYDPTEEEIKRMVTEVNDFHDRITNLQYLPTEQEIYHMIQHLPVQIDGDASEKLQVSNYKNLDRIETDRVRNGPCLVIGEGLTQKAFKFWGKFNKWYKEYGMDHWQFVEDFIDLQKKMKASKVKVEKETIGIKPNNTFIKDIVAGRPVFTHPLREGGFRLRYGRTPTTGLSAQAIHPATMYVTKSFIAIGTQLKVERPGKSTVLASCDSVEGPIVKLNNGSVVYIETVQQAKDVSKDIEEIIHLGDILIPYGDFLDRAHPLVPVGYCEEWYARELEKAIQKKDLKKLNLDSKLILNIINDPFTHRPTVEQAIHISMTLGLPFHPRYTFHWKVLTMKQFEDLQRWYTKAAQEENKTILPYTYNVEKDLEQEDPKRALELLGVPHTLVSNEYIVLEGEWAAALKVSMKDTQPDKPTVLARLNPDLHLKDKGGTYIGARMGRPEKAKLRKLTGSPQALFPVGNEGGRMRSFQAALQAQKIKSDFPIHYCVPCQEKTIYPVCERCNSKTEKKYYCRTCMKEVSEKCHEESTLPYKRQTIDIHHYFESALKLWNSRNYPELIKGVRGTSNKDHTPEHLLKGILRAKNNLYVNKEGTIRYDMTEMPITHFKPKEMGTSITKLKELGYTKDIHGKPLQNEDQILEIQVQDIILPHPTQALDEGSRDVLFRVTKFIDELLVALYDCEPYYNLETPQDIVGHLLVGLAPHTAAGVVGRIIGFSETQGFLAHPYYHSIMRRDCDGDEAGIMLLMDSLLNFSRHFLPNHRGSTQDAPLVLTSHIIPSEVDDMVFNMDIAWKYPLELYEAAQQMKKPWDITIDKVGDHLGTEKEYYGFGYTHPVENFNDGVLCSAYKSIPTMQEKVLDQMELCEKIRAVDEADVAKLIIERHFIRDIKGNLRKFSSQEFRCVNCNEKYRRPPILGKCLACKGKIIFTISEGGVVKYLEPSLSLAEKYDLPLYLRQTLELTKKRIESVFGKDPEKQEGLVKWFG